MLLPYSPSRQRCIQTKVTRKSGNQLICCSGKLNIKTFFPLDSAIPVKCDIETSTNYISSSTSHVALPQGAPNVGHARRFTKGCASLPGVYTTSAGM